MRHRKLDEALAVVGSTHKDRTDPGKQNENVTKLQFQLLVQKSARHLCGYVNRDERYVLSVVGITLLPENKYV